ncbi:hypothetical protein [Paucisalibacillus globulus]|uniref:hypothetical protein n=1 Tax=Paucisalibacillus globulus TaxID=351095 RepID=UPI00047D8E68|nr:hypothetical protein [Paucisalibacillus globulus]
MNRTHGRQEPEIKGWSSSNDVINSSNKTDNVDEAVEIVKSTESKWADTMFYMERGQKSFFGTFESEEDACKYFLDVARKHLRI